jgi:hypothetical protein
MIALSALTKRALLHIYDVAGVALFYGSLLLTLAIAAVAQTTPRTARVSVIVRDENKVPVAGVQVRLSSAEVYTKCETDKTGRCNLPSLPVGTYALQAQRDGFYLVRQPDVDTSESSLIELTMRHLQEVKETVNVTESQNGIDPSQTASSETMNSSQILNIPYPTTRDIRNLLRFNPGVVLDNFGNIHVAGGQSYQTLDVLDGFNMTDPASGFFSLHVNPEAVRAIDIQSSRYSAVYGRTTGGILGLYTGMGDDHYRFLATNFLPSFQFKKGFNFDKWVPRATFSGPLKRGKIWFFDSPDAEYGLNINRDLPDNADKAPFLRFTNFAKIQANLSEKDILTASVLTNWQEQRHAFLALNVPLSATTTLDQTSYFPSLKEQHVFASGGLFEVGAGWLDNSGKETPLGGDPYNITPQGVNGSFFRTSKFESQRFQGFSNFFLPPQKAFGRHEIGIGVDANHIEYDQFFERRPINVLLANHVLGEQIIFPGNGNFTQNNIESGTYLQDRWSPAEHLIVESGVRLDWDNILRDFVVSPRIATTFYLPAHDTKFAFGLGRFYDSTNLSFISRPQQGSRVENFYDSTGTTIVSTNQVRFFADPRNLSEPRALNLSFSVEQKLPKEIFLKTEYIRKRNSDEFVYLNETPKSAGFTDIRLQLRNARQDHYDSVQTSVRQNFKGEYFWSASFTRSSARSNQVLGFSLDSIFDPLFFGTNRGPLPWDAPYRVISYAWAPMPHFKTLDFSYALDWRSGFPFSIVNQQQEILGSPDSHRFPTYFNLGTYLEKRFDFAKMHWAVRGGFDNVTNHKNAQVVDNNIDSGTFLTFSQYDRRTFIARIRFLGKIAK